MDAIAEFCLPWGSEYENARVAEENFEDEVSEDCDDEDDPDD